jgi:uridine kinase
MPDHLAWNHQGTEVKVIVGIAGGSAAGKTTLARALAEDLGAERILHLQQDWYYRDLSHIEPGVRAACNFDYPEALEMGLLRQHLHSLRRGEAVRAPAYDFATHTRLGDWHLLVPQEVVLVEGTLVLADPALRELLDIRVYVDASRETRLGRRLTRDVAERGRDVASCLEQHRRTAWPMHELYVEPSRRHADLVVLGEAVTGDSIAALARRVEECARRQKYVA